MRVLIDECLNWRLGRGLPGHFCTSVQQMGWSGIENGALLEKMRQERFDVFLTGDRNLQFHQHVPASGIAVVVLRGRKHSIGRDASAHAALVETLHPGTITIIPEESASR